MNKRADSKVFEKIHRKAIVIDGHCDTILNIANKKVQIEKRNKKGHLDIPRLQEGGVDIQVFAFFIESIYKPDRAVKRTLQLFDIFSRELKKNEERLSLITGTSQIKKTIRAGKIGVILSIEGGEALEGDLGILRVLYQLGIRLITLTWNQRNQIADGAAEQRTKSGLTEFGVKVIMEMNRLGMLIDISHLSEAGFWDVIKLSEQAVIASHSNCYSLCPHARNLKDDQIKAISDKGGIICVTFVPDFLTKGNRKASLEDVLNHIDYLVKIGGINCVGLGSDFDGTRALPLNLEGVDKIPNITIGLLRRGYKEKEIFKILGGNFLRIFKKIVG